MTVADEHFRALGWTVEDVSAPRPYDMVCRRDNAELHVEVKGTASAGSEILLTPNEVHHARQAFPHVALVIVAEIVVSRAEDGGLVGMGGRTTVIDPWQIEAGTLEPVGYSWRLPDVVR